MANEGCSFTGEKCTKRITILFDGGEVELYNGDVSVNLLHLYHSFVVEELAC